MFLIELQCFQLHFIVSCVILTDSWWVCHEREAVFLVWLMATGKWYVVTSCFCVLFFLLQLLLSHIQTHQLWMKGLCFGERTGFPLGRSELCTYIYRHKLCTYICTRFLLILYMCIPALFVHVHVFRATNPAMVWHCEPFLVFYWWHRQVYRTAFSSPTCRQKVGFL